MKNVVVFCLWLFNRNSIHDNSTYNSCAPTELLGVAGLQVSHYNKGGTFLNALEHIKAEVFIVDITLADHVSGWKIVKRIKSHPQLDNIPIFISSAMSESHQPPELGVDGYLVKLYPLRKLSTIILQKILHQNKRGQILVAEEI